MLNFENKWLRPMMTLSPDDGGGAAPSGGDGGGSGTSVTPAPSPASTDGGGGTVGGAAPAEPAATPAAGPDWSQLGSTDDLDYLAIPVEPPPPPTEPVAPPVPPEQPLQPPPVQPPPVTPTPPPTAAQPPQSDDTRPLTASDPWRIAEGLEANREAVIPHLAATKFALSEEDLRELDADPGAAIPKMLARAFFESQVSMQKFLAQAVPGMIKNFNTVVTANEGAEKKFFDTHKSLDASNPQHREVAARIATVYRKANPGIPLSQLIDEVGPMVMASLRIAPGQAVPQAAPGGGTPPMPRGGTPFRPAVNGGGGAPIATEPANPWSGLGTNYD